MEAFLLKNKRELAERAANCYCGSLVEKAGSITRVETDAQAVKPTFFTWLTQNT